MTVSDLTTLAMVTSTRADWGLLKPLAKQLTSIEAIDFHLIVSGTHLLPSFGQTVSEIISDGFTDIHKVKFDMNGQKTTDTIASTSEALLKYSECFVSLKPDAIILLGDRFEIFAAAVSALMLKIPIVHIHGGELTEGALDDALRHCITKMSSLHFVSTSTYQQRVIQMGQPPETVYLSGALGLENISQDASFDLSDDFEKYSITKDDELIMMTYQPEFYGEISDCSVLEHLLEACLSKTSAKILISYPNADSGRDSIVSVIKNWQHQYPARIIAEHSFGRKRYLSLAKRCLFVIGNSSSGLIEIPSLHVPTINVGGRQKGRVCAKSVINVTTSYEAISKAIVQALNKTFRESVKSVENPYSLYTSPSEFIASTLSNYDYSRINHRFFDMPDNSLTKAELPTSTLKNNNNKTVETNNIETSVVASTNKVQADSEDKGSNGKVSG
jgi:UDP-N-acetylglucosamine 2-epimerase (non-hydrolysing)